MKRIMNKIKEKGAVICALLLCITSIAAMAGCGKMPSSFVISDKNQSGMHDISAVRLGTADFRR